MMTGVVGYSDNRTPGLRGIVSARSCHWQLLEGVAGESSISVSIRRAAPLLATHKMKHMLEVIASWLLIERRSCVFVFSFSEHLVSPELWPPEAFKRRFTQQSDRVCKWLASLIHLGDSEPW